MAVALRLLGFVDNPESIISGLIRGARMCQLRTGHSHEDVDQIFGQLASHLSRKARRASGPHDFRDIIQHWLDHVLVRPHERERVAVVLDQCRDWKLN